MNKVRTTRKIYEANLHKKLPKGRPKARWKHYVEMDIRKTGTVTWRKAAQDRDGSRRAIGEVIILLGLWRRRRSVDHEKMGGDVDHDKII